MTARYIPISVSRYFHLDWNYALRIVRFQVLTWISPLIFATGILTRFFPVMNFRVPQVACLWVASASFLLGFFILRIRAPLFMQEYKNFKEYDDVGHSHRWILWQYNAYLPSLSPSERESVLRELIDKGLAFAVSCQTDELVYGACPIARGPDNGSSELCKPVNLNADLYATFYVDNRSYVLPVQLTDPNAKERQRELFWILYTRCADTRQIARLLVWLLFGTAGCLALLAAAFVVSAIFTTPGLPNSVEI